LVSTDWSFEPFELEQHPGTSRTSIAGQGEVTPGAPDSTLASDDFKGRLRIGGMRNAGRGNALHGLIQGEEYKVGEAPIISMDTHFFTVIAPGETLRTNCDIQIWWKNAKAIGERGKIASFRLTIHAQDSRNMMYIVIYQLFASSGIPIFGTTPFAPGVNGIRKVKRGALSVRKLRSKAQGWLAIGRRELIDWPWDERGQTSDAKPQ
jgi:hypothetical protein